MSQKLMNEILDAIRSAGPFGSVEIIIQNNIVTQITMRNIRKASDFADDRKESNNNKKNIDLHIQNI